MELQKSVNSNEAMVIASLAKKLPKTIFTCLSLCLLCCFSVSVFGQDLIRNTQAGNSSTATNDSSYVAQTLAPDWEATSFESIAPTSINTISDAKIEDFCNYGVLLDLEKGYIDELLSKQPDKLILGIPVNNSNFFELQLSKIDITSNDFKITTSSGASIPNKPSTNLFYWGIVKDNPGSIAAVSFYQDEVRCIISDEDGNYVLGAYEDAHVLYATKDLKQQFDFDCTTTEEFYGDDSMRNINSLTSIELEDFVNVEPILIRVECDYQMYLTFDADIEKVEDHVTALFNESAILFANENIKIQLDDIFVWDTEDPYVHLDSVSVMLTQFSANEAGDYPGKVGIFMTDRDNLVGSAFAYTGGLCTTNYSFAAISVHDPSQVVPVSTYSYDVYTFTHELGHIFGSPHTHVCVWGSDGNSALDNCFDTEGGCAPGPQPTNGGTMMSYCVQEEPFINFEIGFGEEPGNRIRSYVEQRECIDDTTLCNIPYNQLVFDEHSWLSDVIVPEYCNRTEIDMYGYYVHIKSPLGDFIYYNGTFLCEVLLDYCIGYYSEFFPELTASSCGCDGSPPPPCDPILTCNTDPCFEGGVQEWNNIECECEIVEETVEGCTYPQDVNYNVNANCHDESQCGGIEPDPICEDEEIFTKFPWLNDLVNLGNCEGTTITEYQQPTYSFVHIEDSNTGQLYYQDGTFYCSDAPGYFCPDQYGLSNIGYCWSCNDDGNACDILGCLDENACNFDANACRDDGTCTYNNSYKGIVFYAICDRDQNYYLIYLPDGTVLDPFNADGVDFDYPEGATVEFGYVEEKITTCEVADQAVIVECINEIDCEYSTKGTVIFEECDNGVVYYLIELDNGRIIDPYNFDGVNFDYIDGAKVEFSYMPSSEIPCNLADEAVEIICIQEIPQESGCDPNREIFDNYPFLNDLVDFDNCAGVKIRESGQFIIVEDAGGQSLYLNSGTFYCDWESCIEFYLPDGAPCVWNCEGIANKSGSLTNISLKKNPIELIEIIPNPNKGRFSLKINAVIEDSGQPKVELFSIEGKLLKTFHNSDQYTTLNISEFGKGVYLLSVKTNSKQAVEKLVVN